jgi:hypothetical protein
MSDQEFVQQVEQANRLASEGSIAFVLGSLIRDRLRRYIAENNATHLESLLPLGYQKRPHA